MLIPTFHMAKITVCSFAPHFPFDSLKNYFPRLYHMVTISREVICPSALLLGGGQVSWPL